MLVCDRLSHAYRVGDRAVPALSDVTLHLAPGTFHVLVGPSGCGKTTLLRVLADLVRPDSGRITRTSSAPRPTVGYVFQEPRLMPWLTVAGNVGFALKGRLPGAEIARRVGDLLDLTGLAAFADAHPGQLSGGMASRVGLARALAGRPDLLLLDEPFAALDAITRRSLQSELLDLWRQWSPTVVFVTHDVEEAVLMADEISLMRAGAIAARFAIDLPRPRDPTSVPTAALRRRILDRLEAAAEPSDPTLSSPIHRSPPP